MNGVFREDEIDCLSLLKLAEKKGAFDIFQDDLRNICEILLCEILKKNRAQLYLENPVLNKEGLEKLFFYFRELSLGKPLAFLLNKAYFYGLEFYVDENCLIPRPETEILVEKTLDIARGINQKELLIYDFCTGSGNIAVSLTKFLTCCRIRAIDISPKALKVAYKNACFHEVDRRIDFICSDLAQGIKRGCKADIIVSNPPYISSIDMKALPLNVKQEPVLALDGGS
ncbi:MAG: HemK/PrmC family methyltransferase, partial [Candidatus Omnitrophota bacterium]